MDLALLKVVADTGDLQRGEEALQKFTAAGAAAEKQADALGTASGRAKQYSTQIGKASQHTANLTYQLNDIGVMLAAGQNPFMLAMQQGTQINQIWGQLGGGAGAMRSLGVAFKSMISPINVATIAVIAFGAAGVQWIMKMTGAGVTLDDTMKNLDKTMSAVDSAFGESTQRADQMLTRFGKFAPLMQSVLNDALTLKQAQIFGEVAEQAGEIVDEIFGWHRVQSDIARLLNEDTFKVNYSESMFPHITGFMDDLSAIQNALSNEDQLSAAIRARDILKERVNFEKESTDEQRKVLEALNQIITANVRNGVVVKEMRGDYTAMQTVASDLATSMVESLRKQVVERAELLRSAREEVDLKRQEADMMRAVAIYGKESAQVQAMEVAAAERAARAYAEKNNLSKQVTQELVKAYRQTVVTTQQTDKWAQSMSLVNQEISAIAASLANLGGGMLSNVSKHVELEALRQGKSIAQAARQAEAYRKELEFDAKRDGAGTFIERWAINAEEATWRQGQALDAQLEKARELARESAKSAAKGGDEYGDDLTTLQDSLRTEREVLDQWYLEGQATLADRRAEELLTKEEHQAALYALDEKYSNDMIALKQQESSHITSAQNAMYGEMANLLTTFGSKSKAAAAAAIAINTALRVRETLQNTAAASVRALAELGPIAGAPVAASILAYGKVQAAMIAAGGVIQFGAALGGGGGRSGGSTPSSGGIVGGADEKEYNIIITGIDEDGLYSGKTIKKITEAMQEELGDKGLIKWDWQ